MVVYSSDQRFYLGDHGWFDKRFMCEESFRMQLMVRWPGVVGPGSVSSELVQNLDFVETFLEIAGVEVPGDMQGLSLVLLLDGQTLSEWRKSLYYHYYEFYADRRAAHEARRHYGVRTGRYALIHFYNLDEWELYDNQKDPRQTKSVYAAPPICRRGRGADARSEPAARALQSPRVLPLLDRFRRQSGPQRYSHNNWSRNVLYVSFSGSASDSLTSITAINSSSESTTSTIEKVEREMDALRAAIRHYG